MDVCGFFLRVSRKLVISVILYPVFFGMCARGMIEPSSVWFFSLRGRKMESFCRITMFFRKTLSQDNLVFRSR